MSGEQRIYCRISVAYTVCLCCGVHFVVDRTVHVGEHADGCNATCKERNVLHDRTCLLHARRWASSRITCLRCSRLLWLPHTKDGQCHAHSWNSLCCLMYHHVVVMYHCIVVNFCCLWGYGTMYRWWHQCDCGQCGSNNFAQCDRHYKRTLHQTQQ